MKVLLVILMLCVPAQAKSKREPLPEKLLAAKSVYLVNDTGRQETLDIVFDQFTKWGRFSIAKTKDSSDLIVVFSHKSGLYEGTTEGFTNMNVFVKGSSEPAFETTEHFKPKLFGQSSIKSCVSDFRSRLEN